MEEGGRGGGDIAVAAVKGREYWDRVLVIY